MRRDGVELMKGSKKRRQMRGSWIERSGRIFKRLQEEANRSLVSNLCFETTRSRRIFGQQGRM
jgi:hypothetical protein